MRLETQISVEVDEDVEYFPHFSIESHEKGTRIKATSPIFAAHFETLAKGEQLVKGSGLWKGATFVVLSKPVGLMMSPSAPLFVNEGQTPNLVWLLMKELKEGLDIIVPEPLSPNNLEDYFTGACDALRDYYLTHIRKVKLQASLRYKGRNPESFAGVRPTF